MKPGYYTVVTVLEKAKIRVRPLPDQGIEIKNVQFPTDLRIGEGLFFRAWLEDSGKFYRASNIAAIPAKPRIKTDAYGRIDSPDIDTKAFVGNGRVYPVGFMGTVKRTPVTKPQEEPQARRRKIKLED